MQKNKETYKPDGITGSIFEEDCLISKKTTITKPDYRKTEYQKLVDAASEVVNRNPYWKKGEESDPPTQWATNLHYFLAHDELKLENLDNLKLYPALHTALDVYHGVDLLIVYIDPKTQKKVIITVDLTKRPEEKGTKFSADILISPTGAVTRNLKGFNLPDLEGETAKECHKREEERLQKTATLIANIIKEKLEHGDEHYGNLANKIFTVVAQIREKISSVTETAHPFRKTG